MNWEKHFRDMKQAGARKARPEDVSDYGPVQFGSDWAPPKFTGIMLADDMKALNDYFHQVIPVTNEAKRLVSDWAQWWITTGAPDNYTFLIPNAVFDEARNRKLAFDRSNAVTQHEKDLVEQVAKTGMTHETMLGESDRRDPVTGGYYVPPTPILPKWFWPVVIGSVALGVGVPIVRKVLLPF